MVVRTRSRTYAPFGKRAAWLGSSEMAKLMRAFDWSQTPLGPIDAWPQSLKSAVAICLRSPLQMAIYWGPELNCIYNDAERDVLGDLHPDALGLPVRELLRESWPVVGPQLEAVIESGAGIVLEDQPLTFDQQGRPDVSYVTYSYSPLLDDDDQVGGVLLTAEDTIKRERHEGELRALLSDLRAAQRRVAAAGDAERRRVERDLHDGAQQRLMAIRLELGLLRELLDSDPGAARKRLDVLHAELHVAVEQLRELAHGLYPPLLASDGLYAAPMSVARHSAIPVTVDGQGMARAPRAIESAAYFCCLEALQNATKHAGPGASVSIHVRLTDGALRFSVRDDGAGFDPEGVSPGYGLTNLRDRIDAVGGQVEVSSAPGRGTTVEGRILVS